MNTNKKYNVLYDEELLTTALNTLPNYYFLKSLTSLIT